MAANVTALRIGGQAQSGLSAATVKDIAQLIGLDSDGKYSVKVNNQAASMDTTLSDGDFVSFGEKIKGGQA